MQDFNMEQDRLREMNDFYKFPNFKDTDIVVDIGTNSGDFILAAIHYGARNIEGYEISKKSFLEACKKVPDYVKLHNKAVWRSDVPEEIKYNSSEEGYETLSLLLNTGGDTPAETISLDNILSTKERVDYLKMDCEGAEYPILYTSKLLYKVKYMVIEVHNFSKENIKYTGIDKSVLNSEDLRVFLIERGFAIPVFPTKNAAVDFIYATRL